MSSGWINSFNNRSFGFYGGTNESYAAAWRDLTTALAEGDQFEVLLAMNYSSGYRGIDLQDASGNNLVNFGLGPADTYSCTIFGEFTTNLGWGYSATAVVQVVAEQLAGNQLSITLTRNDGLTTNLTSTALTQPLGRINLYNGGHNGDDIRQALYANDLLITRGGGMTDGIPNAWWNKYSVAASNRVASLDIDGDGAPNDDEYPGDTDPTDNTRSFRNRILKMSGAGVVALQVGPNTTNSRTYDVWWSTNLVAVPQEWTPFGLNAAAAIDGGALNMVVTNDVPRRFYRASVSIP
jgi:hypothetical protein